jgi:hypothetical protein
MLFPNCVSLSSPICEGRGSWMTGRLNPFFFLFRYCTLDMFVFSDLARQWSSVHCSSRYVAANLDFTA